MSIERADSDYWASREVEDTLVLVDRQMNAGLVTDPGSFRAAYERASDYIRHSGREANASSRLPIPRSEVKHLGSRCLESEITV